MSSNFLRVAGVPDSLGFKDHCKWWAGVELGRRLILMTFIIVFGRNEVRNNILPSGYLTLEINILFRYLFCLFNDHIWSVRICCSL